MYIKHKINNHRYNKASSIKKVKLYKNLNNSDLTIN